MCVWQMSATDHLCMLSSRAPAMAERVWNPFGGQSYEGYSSRVTATGKLLHKLLAAVGSLPVPVNGTGPPPANGTENLQPGCLDGCGGCV